MEQKAAAYLKCIKWIDGELVLIMKVKLMPSKTPTRKDFDKSIEFLKERKLPFKITPMEREDIIEW